LFALPPDDQPDESIVKTVAVLDATALRPALVNNSDIPYPWRTGTPVAQEVDKAKMGMSRGGMMSQSVLPSNPKIERRRMGKAAAVPSTGDESLPSILWDVPVLRSVAARIGIPELRRRLVHMSPVVLPFFLWGIPHRDPWGPILINAVLTMAVVMVGLALYRFRLIARSRDEQGLASVIGYAFPVLMALVLLPGRAELAMMTLGIVSLGDGSATLGGLWFRGHPLPWNNRKTFSGFLSFCVCGTVIGTAIYWGEAHPGVSWQTALACASISTLAAAFVESLPLSWNDNLRVGTTAALVGTVVQIAWLGR
jgi:dolichol kinase